MAADGRVSPVGSPRILQLIVAAITGGAASFLVVVIVAVGAPSKSPSSPIVTYVAVAFAGAMLVARVIVPSVFVANARRSIAAGTWHATPSPWSAAGDACSSDNSDISKLAQVFSVRTILSVAILEGTAFFAIVAYLVERSPISLGLAVLLVLAVAAHFPTQSRVAEWLETQKRLLDDARQL